MTNCIHSLVFNQQTKLKIIDMQIHIHVYWFCLEQYNSWPWDIKVTRSSETIKVIEMFHRKWRQTIRLFYIIKHCTKLDIYDGILHPSNKLGSHIDALCGHNNMLGGHVNGVGGHINMLEGNREDKGCDNGWLWCHIDGLETIPTCWEVIWIGSEAIVTFWKAIQMGLEAIATSCEITMVGLEAIPACQETICIVLASSIWHSIFLLWHAITSLWHFNLLVWPYNVFLWSPTPSIWPPPCYYDRIQYPYASQHVTMASNPSICLPSY